MESDLRSVLDDPAWRAAVAHARASAERTLVDQMELTAIPAPPFREEARGTAMSARLSALGLSAVHTDAVGNVLALRPGTAALPPVILSAHLDTVFGEHVEVRAIRTGDHVAAPGISDDGRGLAVLLATARALDAGGVVTRRPILFVATVGEEGLGDLRGAKHLMGPDGGGRDGAAFITVDGAGLDRIVTRGLGSRRFRVTARGPGGHSWVDRGLANPIHALGRLVADLSETPIPPEADSALTVARWGGGTSINAIPQDAWVEIDARSVSAPSLEEMEDRLRTLAEEAVTREAARQRGPVTVEVDRIGLRPAGETDPGSALVRAACAATEAVGANPCLVTSSTDANAAMAVGVPAIAVGGGGEAGSAHTTDEWYRDAAGTEGVVRALYTLALLCGA